MRDKPTNALFVLNESTKIGSILVIEDIYKQNFSNATVMVLLRQYNAFNARSYIIHSSQKIPQHKTLRNNKKTVYSD